MSIFTDDKQYHLKTAKGDVGRYVILCGDPGRVPKIAAHFDDARHVVTNREYVTYTGELGGVKVSAVSTGIGGPSSAICVEELINCGADTFIRVGTSGGMYPDVKAGDLVIASAAVRDDGTSAEYMPLSYPAAADFSLCRALADSAERLGVKTHIGVVHSKDSFYGETHPGTMPVGSHLKQRWAAYMQLGCLASEMECAAIYAVAAARGVRASSVLLSVWNVDSNDGKAVFDTENAIKCAVGAFLSDIARAV
jgi:uridine phosphorylase